VLDQLVDLDAYIENWRHTAEDEIKAVNGINALLQASTPNQALLMGGNFVQAPPAPVPQAYAQAPVQQAPVQVAPQVAATQPNVVQVAGGSVDLSEDVFTTPPVAQANFTTDMSDFDIDSLLGALEQPTA
jgi:hypothetical protein